jgi:hypothetical protein
MGEARTTYRVAAHFGAEGYGGVSEFVALDEAMKYRARLLSIAYPAVHVWRVTTERIAGFDAALPGEGSENA